MQTAKKMHNNMHRNQISESHRTANLMKDCKNVRRQESPNKRDEQPKQVNPTVQSELKRKAKSNPHKAKSKPKKKNPNHRQVAT
jgi:hypothetical protein